MFAYLPALTVLLALTSSVSPVMADNGKEPFSFDIEITFDDPKAAKISDSDKKIISDAVVKSFNDVHNTDVIELYSFDLKKFDVNPNSSYLSQLLPNALTQSGGTYSWGSGSGGNCRACGNDDLLGATDLTYTHNKWQTDFAKLLANSGSSALAKASNVVIKVDGESSSLSEELLVEDVTDDVKIRDSNKEDFSIDIEFTFDDPKAAQISDSDKKIISDAVVKSFNDVHNTEVIELYSFDLKKFDVKPNSSYLSYLLPSALTQSGGTYSWGSGSGGNCRACGNDDMLGATDLTYTHNKWQTDFAKLLANSGSPALAKASNVVIKVNGESASLDEVRDSNKEDFNVDIEMTFNDPLAAKINGADKKTISDCVVKSFNEVHDTDVIELYSFDLKKFDITPGSVLSLIRGTPVTQSGGTYSWGSGSGGNCRACGNDDMLGADMITYTHNKWQKACNECVAASGSKALAGASNLIIKLGGEKTEASE